MLVVTKAGQSVDVMAVWKVEPTVERSVATKVALKAVQSVVSLVDLRVARKAAESAGLLEIVKGKTLAVRMVAWSAETMAGTTADYLAEHWAALLDVNSAAPMAGYWAVQRAEQ